MNSTGYDLVAGRVTNISGAQAGSGTSGVLEAFKYLGASTVAERSRPEVGITLTMATTTGATGDGGDKYTGLDRFGRVVDQRWITGSGSSASDIDRYGYTYDEHGNRTGRSNALAAAFSETYGYEGLNQLQSFTRGDAESPSLTQGWQFDALGNWTTFTTNGTDQTRVFNAQNELLQVGSTALTYSATGNMTTDAQGRTLVYDAWNRLVLVHNALGTQIAAYQYDGMNRRIAEQVAATGVSSAPVRDMFYSQSWQVLEERVRTAGGDIPATADTRYVWSPVYVDALVARDRNADANTSTGTGGLEERVYALQDANWNTTAIVAASGVSGFSTGAIINRFVYTPYGESQTLTASWGTPAAGSSRATPWQHLFQGLKFSDVTGLAYVRARDYSATLGRFIELDPIGFSAGDNNWYRFVGNGPTGSTDPSGLAEVLPLAPIIVGGPYYWEPHTGKPYSHLRWLSQDYEWTYSKHTITFGVNTRLSDSDVLDIVLEKLRRFQHFESNLASARVNADRSMAYFNLKNLAGLASDWAFNDSEVQVFLAQTGAYELTGTTAGRHQLIGIRKWRVFHDPNPQICGRKMVTIETEADEMPYWPINRFGSYLKSGRAAQVEIWKGYLERTAVEVSRELGGDGNVGAATLRHPPTEASCPRRNRFFP